MVVNVSPMHTSRQSCKCTASHQPSQSCTSSTAIVHYVRSQHQSLPYHTLLAIIKSAQIRSGPVCWHAVHKLLPAHENLKQAFMAVQVGWGM